MDEVKEILGYAATQIDPGLPTLVVLGMAAAFLIYKWARATISVGLSLSAFWCAYTLNNASVSEESHVPLYMIAFVGIGFLALCHLFYALLFKENT